MPRLHCLAVLPASNLLLLDTAHNVLAVDKGLKATHGCGQRERDKRKEKGKKRRVPAESSRGNTNLASRVSELGLLYTCITTTCCQDKERKGENKEKG